MTKGQVGVVGLGYVGLPLSLALAGAGYNVIGVDIDDNRVNRLRDGESYVDDVADEQVNEHLGDGFSVTTEYMKLSSVDGVAICVPTPLEKTRRPNLSYVVDAAERLAEVVPDGCVVILESTIYPQATEQIVAPILTENGHEVGEDVFVAYSPERIDPGNEQFGLTEIPKVIGGVTQECGIRAQALYEPVFEELVPVQSATEAELVKLLENTFRTVNIALINELATIAHELDVDIWDTIDAAATKPFGFMPFYPGPGLGGHCLPVDPLYLSWKAGQHGLDIEFIELADKINRNMPEHVVERTVELLNADGIPVPEANMLVAGVAYKADVSDVRESPAFDVISHLRDREADVTYHDPHVPTIEVEGTTYESTDDPVALATDADIVIVLTDHASIDMSGLVNAAPLVLDTRNATDSTEPHVHRL